MFGKRGENPPLPRNCKRSFSRLHKPLPFRAGRRGRCCRSQVRRPVPPSSWSALSRAKEDLMSRLSFYCVRLVSCSTIALTTIVLVLFASSSRAQSTPNLHGKVVDQLSSRVPDANIVLLENDNEIVAGKSDGQGSFSLAAP